MGIVSQYSRLQHHTIYGLTGSTFSVPATEDFTDGSWSIYDLCLSEIGVNETDEKAYIRIGNTIKEFEFATGTATPISIYGDNGITVTGSTVSFGGTLSQATSIEGHYGLSLGTLSSRLKSFGVETDDSIFVRDDDGSNLSVLDMSAAGGASILSSSVQSSGAGSEFSAGSYGKGYMKATTGADYFQIELDAESATNKRMLVIDTISSRGLQYAADYSGQFITHSLITKAYLQSSIGNYLPLTGGTISGNLAISTFTSSVGSFVAVGTGGLLVATSSPTQNLEQVLATGNTMGTFSINMGTGKLLSAGETSSFTMTDFETRHVTNQMSYQLPVASWSQDNTYNIVEGYSSGTSSVTIFTIVNASFPTESVVTIDVIIQGLDPTNMKYYFNKMMANFWCSGGVLTQIGTTDVNEKSNFTSAASTINTDTSDVRVNVQGDAVSGIYWTARINYQISGGA